MKNEFVHISQIEIGDCIVVAGVMKTMSRGDIKSGFMGRTIFGDSFRLGADKVERCLFPKWFKGEITGYHPQI